MRKTIIFILSVLYLFLICLPISIFIYCSVIILYSILDFHRFIKKTIKNAQTKRFAKFN